MNYKLSTELLSRDEVITETVNRLQPDKSLGEELTLTDSYEDTCWVMKCIKEVVNDPYDTLNHVIPGNIFNDENKLSDYYYLIACDVQKELGI